MSGEDLTTAPQFHTTAAGTNHWTYQGMAFKHHQAYNDRLQLEALENYPEMRIFLSESGYGGLTPGETFRRHFMT